VDRKVDQGTVQQASVGWHDALELQKISTLLIQEGDVDALYARVLEAATDLTSADMASLQAFSSERGELRLLAHRGFHPESAAFHLKGQVRFAWSERGLVCEIAW
jgi:hypothetical protein